MAGGERERKRNKYYAEKVHNRIRLCPWLWGVFLERKAEDPLTSPCEFKIYLNNCLQKAKMERLSNRHVLWGWEGPIMPENYGHLWEI